MLCWDLLEWRKIAATESPTGIGIHLLRAREDLADRVTPLRIALDQQSRWEEEREYYRAM